MKGLENDTNFILLLVANAIAFLQFIAAWKWPRYARISFFLLFAWAAWINWKTSIVSPADYLEYGELTWSGLYKKFIYGWFADHTRLAVGFIASCQGIIAISMLMKEDLFRLGAIAGIIFLVAILPLGVGSGFPCTAIMAAALFLLIRRRQIGFVWERSYDSLM